MEISPYSENYVSSPSKEPMFPSLSFYMEIARIVWNGGRKASSGTYTGADWIEDSLCVARLIEHVGGKIEIEGVENLEFDGPCVFEANHMSTLETLFLPCIIQPRKDVTFVVKQSLLKYPCLGTVLAARSPIALGRTNPREDLLHVMEDGCRILGEGRSIIIFTQGTRKNDVEEKGFNTLGVKLARKAGVPVVPIALKTDLWGSGSLIKDLGSITPSLPVHVRFGTPLNITGAKHEHGIITAFIKSSFDKWASHDGTAL